MNPTLTISPRHVAVRQNWFMPQELTPLYKTTVYGDLTEAERLSYNQLHALYFHEQIIFFEQSIICPALAAVLKTCGDTSLRSSIEQFIAEENGHSAQFHEVLRQTVPEMYKGSPRYFIRNNPLEAAGLNWCVSHPRVFPMYLWLILLLEERAMYCSRAFLAQGEDADSPFFQIQRQHLADEVDHVQWDEEVIAAIWDETPVWLKKMNVRLMDWMLREFIVAPKRAAVRVLDALVDRHPDLVSRLPRLKQELRELGQTREFQQSIFCAPVAPRSERLMAKYPEFDRFRAYWFRHEN